MVKTVFFSFPTYFVPLNTKMRVICLIYENPLRGQDTITISKNRFFYIVRNINKIVA